MQKLDGHLKAKNFEEAEKTADSILKMMGASAEPPAVSAEAVGKRISGKVERVKEGLQKWAASGHDPSAILKTMQEKVGPLLDAGKPLEAEAELDRVLEQLGQPKAEAQEKEPRPTTPPAVPVEAVRKRISEKVERVKEGVQKMGGQWARSIGHPQDDAGEGRAAIRRWQDHRRGSRAGSRARTARPAEGRSPGQGAPSRNGADCRSPGQGAPSHRAVPSGFGLVHRGQSERPPARPRLGFADHRTDAQVRPPSGAHAEGADDRPGAYRDSNPYPDVSRN